MLVRLRLVTGQAVVKASAGRGAWIHPSQECIEKACKTRAFGRAFRGPVGPVDASALFALVTTARREQP